MRKCNCGCGNDSQTSTGWVKGHWNKGKKHAARRKPGTRAAAIQVKREEESASRRLIREKKALVKLNSCKCGCGALVKGIWKWGHHSRVNNISKRDDIREKRRVSMKERHGSGIMPEVWNKGKTKKTDERLASQGTSISQSFTDERKERYSKTMRENRLDGTIPTLTGSNHPQWKGGTSSITQRVRGSHTLHELWRYPILKRDNFTCQKCKNPGKLAVHHYDERMAEIISNYITDGKHELTWEEESSVVERIVLHHVTKQVFGITLCYECHEVVHNKESELDKHLSLSEICS